MARQSGTFRLPAFSPEEADLWLVQVDCAFDVAGIADDTVKFKLLVANLPVHVASQVRDVVTATPPSFTNLITALRSRLAQSRASRLEALLRDQQLGDQQPTQLLRNMQHMLGGPQDDTGLLRTLFLQRLPHTTRAALALLAEDTKLEDLASAADRFHNASHVATVAVASAPTTAPVSRPADTACCCQPGSTAPTANSELTAAVSSLTATVARLEASFQRLNREDQRERRSRSRPRRQATPGATGTRQPQTPGADSDHGYCWYHQRWGADAHQCRQPCTWQGN